MIRSFIVATLVALTPALAAAQASGERPLSAPGLPPVTQAVEENVAIEVRAQAPAPAIAAAVPPERTDQPRERIRATEEPVTPARVEAAPERPKESQPTPATDRGPRRPARAEQPPRMIRAESGANIAMAIAVSHLNRIVTPFAAPVVKTTSTATVMAEGPIVYVATNLNEPVGVFVHEEADPTVAISLTLIPAEIPAISTEIELVGHTPNRDAGTRKSVRAAAEASEQAHPYPQMIVGILRDLANNRVPDGYGFEALKGPHPYFPHCRMPGVDVRELQLLTGAEVMVFVARARNLGPVPIEIDEDRCRAAHVRAVAAWPQLTIGPGESTELYVVVSAPHTIETRAERPSVVGGF